MWESPRPRDMTNTWLKRRGKPPETSSSQSPVRTLKKRFGWSPGSAPTPHAPPLSAAAVSVLSAVLGARMIVLKHDSVTGGQPTEFEHCAANRFQVVVMPACVAGWNRKFWVCLGYAVRFSESGKKSDVTYPAAECLSTDILSLQTHRSWV
jgi:hypothetical protein